MNDLLRRALADARLTEAGLAARLGGDPKTVHRWVAGRVPYPRHRTRIATLVGRGEAELWPQLAVADVQAERTTVDVLATYSHGWACSSPRLAAALSRRAGRDRHTWPTRASSSPRIWASCARAERARNGVSVRILLGDPDGTCVAERGSDEGVGESVAARIRNALVHYQALRDVEGAEIRLHDTVLYNSIYRADDDLLINARLRHRRIPCPRPAPAQSRRRRHGEHIPGEL